ncbi:CHAP domain-containing protein [Marinithermofilum abyssi]|nr:CHAP domain-containing protein [Marinithermofilum abyssi]
MPERNPSSLEEQKPKKSKWKKVILVMGCGAVAGMFFMGFMSMVLFLSMFGSPNFLQKHQKADQGKGVYCRPGGKPITVKELDQNLKGKGVFEGKAQQFIDAGEQNGVDPVLVAAIALHETGNGKSKAVKQKNNPGGLMGSGGLMSFSSLDEGINKMASNLYRLYIKEGLTTPDKIGPKYAPVGAANDPNGLNKHWVPTVKKYIKQLGGLSYKCETAGRAGKVNGSAFTAYPYKNASTSGVDAWGFYNRQCTSYVAWRLNDVGIPFHNRMKGGHFSNATNWDDNAKRLGIRMDQTPEPGAVAQWDAGEFRHSRFGHVAYVAEVLNEGKKIRIEEYNFKPFAYSERTIPADKVSHYIHFK